MSDDAPSPPASAENRPGQRMIEYLQIAQTGFEGGAFILALWTFSDRFRNARRGQPEQASDWFKRKSDQRFDPYPDINGNTSSTIKGLFLAGTIGQNLFFLATAIWLTLLLIPLLYLQPLPTGFVGEVDLLATLAAIVAFFGAILFFLCIRSLASKRRRYILSYIALWMGFRLKEEDRPEHHEPRIPAGAIDPKLMRQAKEARKANRRGRR